MTENKEEEQSASKPESGMPVFESEAQKISPREKLSRKGEWAILLGIALLLIATFFLNTAVFAATEPVLVITFVLGIVLIVAGATYRKSKLGHF